MKRTEDDSNRLVVHTTFNVLLTNKNDDMPGEIPFPFLALLAIALVRGSS